MPSSVLTADYPWGLDGGTYEGTALRTHVNAALLAKTGAGQVISGVLPGGGELAVTAGTGMTVSVATGYCAVASSAGSAAGGYTLGLTTAAVLTVATADPTNPRLDLVCMTVTDNGSSTSTGMVQVITGTPASSPAAPALPGTAPYSSVPLATVLVPASSTSVSAGNITGTQSYSSACGGILPVQAITSGVPAGYPGMYIHDRSTGRLRQNGAGGVAQALILPFAPVMAAATAPVTNTGSETTVLSASVTSTGGDLKISIKWPGITATSGTGSVAMIATMRIYIGTSQVDTCYAANFANDGNSRGGGEYTHYTSGVLGDTPSAGTHTVRWAFTQNYGGAGFVQVFGATYAPLTLRAEPVVL